MPLSNTLRNLALALAGLLALSAGSARAQDDTALFSTAVAPNVLLSIDNSGSMNEIMWHPSYVASDPTACPIFNFIPPNSGAPPGASGGGTISSTPYFCDVTYGHCRLEIDNLTSGFTSTGTYTCPGGGGTTRPIGYITRSFCGRSRKLYIDPDNLCKGNKTWVSETYLEWYYSSAADAHWLNNEANTSTDITKVDANRNGTHYINNQSFPLYKRTRITAAREIARDVIYQINSNCVQGGGFPCPSGGTDRVRFGVAQFDPNTGAPGGYVKAEIGNYSGNATLLDGAIGSLDAETSTPLAETLFKDYTYFMSRTAADRPFGANGTTRFPKYQYRLSDGANTTTPPGDPISCPPSNAPCACQKNFVIMITDGFPTRDDFSVTGTGNSNTTGRTVGFADFVPRLIGDYNADGEVEQPVGSDGWKYLDDLAKWMATQDFRPDLTGEQTIDIYTVGFATDANANSLLQKTADVGNGLFFTGTQAQELTDALVSSIQSIILKSQSFTAATVPATRTSSGGKFYNSLFVPSTDSGYWEGHLQSWTITEAGEILDSTGNCAFVGDPVPCSEGTLDPNATPWWDAGNVVPPPGSRNLFTSVNGTPTLFNPSTMDETLLTLAAGDAALYDYTPPSAAPATLGELADMVVMNVRGCQFGTGAGAAACVTRQNAAGSPHILGDIFHSNPVVVGRPRGAIPEQSYRDFKSETTNPNVGLRDQVMVAGANDGVFRVFDAGSWADPDGPGPLEPGYDAGTGGEVAGFLPYTARRNVKQLARDDGSRDYYFTDGSPVVSDAWFYTSPTASLPTDKNLSQWHTVVVAGMRQGGNQYFALDITDPTASPYPGYLWEFPAEGAPASVTQWMGQTWSEPIITKVRLAVDGDLLNPQERWVAVFAGGYAESGDPNKPLYDLQATAGRSITMLDLKTGGIVAQKKFVDTTAPVATDPTTIVYNPLLPEASMAFALASTPGVFDLDADGFADLVYVGDLGGNVWKWVIDDVGHDPVNSAGLPDTSQPAWHFEKFFAAPVHTHSVTGLKHYKSFFFNPSATLKSGDLWLAFGSGERADLKFAGYAAPEDENNRFYSVKDLDPLAINPAGIPMDETNLLDITSDASCSDVASFDGLFFKGVDGEKFVTASDIFFYYVFVASFTPTTSTDPCQSAGDASLYAFKVYCGEGLFDDATGNPVLNIDLGDGMPTDPKVSLSGDQSQVFINKKDEVLAPPVPFKLDEAGGSAVWRERHED